MTMKEKIAVITIFCICIAILIGAQMKADSNITPEHTILGLIKAAEKDNTKGYLAYFCDELKANLEDQSRKMGEGIFNQIIVKNYANLMGIAISDQRQISTNLIHLTVEFVFEGYDEIKSYLFKKTTDGWKVKMIINGHDAG